MLGFTDEEIKLMPIGTEIYGLIFLNDLKRTDLDVKSIIFTFDYEKGVWFSPGLQKEEDTKNNRKTVYFEHNELKKNTLLADYGILLKYKKEKNEGNDLDWKIEREYTYTTSFQTSISTFFKKKNAKKKQEQIQKEVDEKLKEMGSIVTHGKI